MNRCFHTVFIALFVTTGVAACGDSASETCGAPGATQACLCAGGAPGAQSCGTDGAWAACECAALSDTSVDDVMSTDIMTTDLSQPDAALIVGCTDSDARNYSVVANSDDGSCRYDVTFGVNVGNLNVEDIVYVGGNFQTRLTHEAWCATCTPMTDGGSGVWTRTVTLPKGEYQYRYLINSWENGEVVPEECSVTNAGYQNRTFSVTDAPVVLDVPRLYECPCIAEACTGINSCVDYRCANRFAGNYPAGRYTIETDRNNCSNKMGFSVGYGGNVRLYGVDPTTGEADFSFSQVQCTAPFRGSSLNMTIDIEPGASSLVVTAPNVVSGSLNLILKHATFSKTVTSTFAGTISEGGRITGTLTGLPQTVNIGLDTKITAGTFAAPE